MLSFNQARRGHEHPLLLLNVKKNDKPLKTLVELWMGRDTKVDI